MKKIHLFPILAMMLFPSLSRADAPSPDFKGVTEVMLIAAVVPSDDATKVGITSDMLHGIAADVTGKMPAGVRMLNVDDTFRSKNGITVIISLEIGKAQASSNVRPFKASAKVFEDATIAREGKSTQVVIYENWAIGLVVGKDFKAPIDAVTQVAIDFAKQFLKDNPAGADPGVSPEEMAIHDAWWAQFAKDHPGIDGQKLWAEAAAEAESDTHLTTQAERLGAAKLIFYKKVDAAEAANKLTH